MLIEKCRIGVMLNLIQHLLLFVEIAGQARNDVALNKKDILRHNIINYKLFFTVSLISVQVSSGILAPKTSITFPASIEPISPQTCRLAPFNIP